MAGRGSKPGERRGGRGKGTPNKTTAVFKQAVLNVFNKNGGEKWFADWAKSEPTEFFKIASRLIPQEVNGAIDGSLTVKILRFGN